jgi:hypothetical protein
MTLSCLLLIPEGLTFDLLSEEQQTAIEGVFGQYVMPMPGTVPVAGMQLCDAITGDNFDPNTMEDYGIDWPILGLWDAETGEALIPFLSESFTTYLAPVVVTDEDGNLISSTPATLHESHRWAGHSEREGFN